MSRFFDALDRYKFGLIAACAVYVLVFIYLKMKSHIRYVPYESVFAASHVEVPEDEFELKPENIMVPQEMQDVDIKNMSRDENDTRDRSYDEYFENASTGDQAVQSVYDLEKQMLAEAGGRKNVLELLR